MKKIIATVVLAISMFGISTISVIATNPMPITKANIDEMLYIGGRKRTYDAAYNICNIAIPQYYNQKFVSAGMVEQAKIIMDETNSWKNETEKTRVLTNDELNTIDYIKVALLNEIKTPGRASFITCDTINMSLSANANIFADNFVKQSKILSDEYKTANFIKVKDNLQYFDSKTMSGQVVVIKDKKLALYTKEINTYKAVIVEKTNMRGKVIGNYVFIPQKEIMEKNIDINGIKVSIMSPELILKAYVSLAPFAYDAPNNLAPVKKVGSVYYSYKLFR